jgi:hypothetical protein
LNFTTCMMAIKLMTIKLMAIKLMAIKLIASGCDQSRVWTGLVDIQKKPVDPWGLTGDEVHAQ